MPEFNEGGKKEFAAFLKGRPTWDEANSGRLTVVTGQVFQCGDGKVAVTTADGQTLEIEAAAVEQFKVVDSSDIHPVVQLHVLADSLAKAAVKTVKPIFKELSKDVIKDVVQDGTARGKDIATDPITDHKPVFADSGKELIKDPVKEVATDGVLDPIGTGIADTLIEGIGGTGVAETAAEGIGGFDPGGPVVNPAVGAARMAAGQAGMMPFVMATPHHAAAHLVAQQTGAQPTALGATAGAGLKPFASDTTKELALETIKEPVLDTRKEMVWDTRKEMVWDTWVETGGTWQEGYVDPGSVVNPPVWGLPGTQF